MSKVKNGDTVSVHYTGKLDDGTIFDTSVVEGREPLRVTLGQGQLIPGFEKALIDMEIGQQKTVKIEAVDAYGSKRDELIVEVPKNNFPSDIWVGIQLQAMTEQGPVIVKVLEIKDDSVLIDSNHPLAEKNLTFELEVVSID
jgi:peptidylprolyl isomerase